MPCGILAQSPLSPVLGVPRVCIVDFVWPLVIVETKLILAFQWVGLTIRLTGCGVRPHPHLMGCCARCLHHWVGFIPVPLVPIKTSFVCVPLMELIGWCCAVLWSQPSSMLVLGPLGRVFGADPGHLLPVTSQGLHGSTYEVILFALVLSFEACEGDHTVRISSTSTKLRVTPQKSRTPWGLLPPDIFFKV